MYLSRLSLNEFRNYKALQLGYQSDLEPGLFVFYGDNAQGKTNLSVANGQLAACWVALTPDGRYAFTIDAHNAAISSYAIANNGSLTLVNGTAFLQATSSIPLLDASVSGDGRFLYVVDVGTNTIDAFRIGPGASLSAIGSTSGLPAGAGGLAAS